MNDETIKAAAEAVMATANFATKALDTGMSLGAMLKGPVNEVVGAWEDRTKIWRWERRVKLFERVRYFAEERNLKIATRELPPRFVLPLIENAELQDDDDLQEISAQLLVNTADASTNTEPRVAYVSILSQMTRLDPQICRYWQRQQLIIKENSQTLI